MRANTERISILALLIISAALSTYMLAVDQDLWAFNPITYHAYALIGFVIVDLVLIGLILARVKYATLLTMLWGGLQVVLIAGDVMTGMGIGMDPSVAFNQYILGIGADEGPATAILMVLYALIGIVSLVSLLALRKEHARESVPRSSGTA